jgi:ribonuclease HII
MENKAFKKVQIGVDVAGLDNVVGPITIAMVVVDTNFFREYGMFLDSTNKGQAYNIFKKNVEYMYIGQIRPDQVSKQNKSEAIAKEIIGSLNTFKQFWKHDIKIKIYGTNVKRFILDMMKNLPANLIHEDIDYETWEILEDSSAKIIRLASFIANSHTEAELMDIANVYGDFGTGKASDPKTIEFREKNKDCVHIRRD